MKLAALLLMVLVLVGCGDDKSADPQPDPAMVVHFPVWVQGRYWVFKNTGGQTAHNVYVHVTECDSSAQGYTTPRDIPAGADGFFPDPSPGCSGIDHAATIEWD